MTSGVLLVFSQFAQLLKEELQEDQALFRKKTTGVRKVTEFTGACYTCSRGRFRFLRDRSGCCRHFLLNHFRCLKDIYRHGEKKSHAMNITPNYQNVNITTQDIDWL